MDPGDMFDGQCDPGDVPPLIGQGFLRGPKDERGRRRECQYLAVLLTFCGVIFGVLALAKLVSGNVSGLVFALFAAGLFRFSWSLWNRKAETER